MKTQAELEAENRELRERLTRAEKTIDRLLAEPPRVEVRKETVKEFVPYPVAPVAPYIPRPLQPWPPNPPAWWEVPRPWEFGPGTWCSNSTLAYQC